MVNDRLTERMTDLGFPLVPPQSVDDDVLVDGPSPDLTG